MINPSYHYSQLVLSPFLDKFILTHCALGPAMPPHISRGTPRQQRRICVPSPLWFCKCRECIEYPCYDPQMNEVQNGRYVTESQFKLHSRRERQRSVAAAHYLAEAGPKHAPTLQPQTIPVDRQREDSASPEEVISMPRKKRRQRNPKLSASLPQVSSQLRELASSLSVLNSESFREGFQRHPAVFTHPPQPYGPPSTEVLNFELDPYAPSNHAFLQYERSLQEASDFLHRCSSSARKLSRVDSLRLTRLQKQVIEEQERASQLKQDLWQHQRSISIASQNAGKTVDTGWLFAFAQVG